MEKIRSWLVRQRDQTHVSYSRFGRPGEEEDDSRPPPTTILVAPFNENAPEFQFFQCWHIQKAAAACACFGMSIVIVMFVSSFFEFNWYHHQRGVDISALIGLFTYLALGVLVHYYVLYGIKKQNAYYLLPFIVVYSVVVSGEVGLCLALIFKAIDPGTTPHPPLVTMLVATMIVVVVQSLMLYVVLQCRHYLSRKYMHDLEVKVAHRSKTENPQITIVMAEGATPASAAHTSQHQTNGTVNDGAPTGDGANAPATNGINIV